MAHDRAIRSTRVTPVAIRSGLLIECSVLLYSRSFGSLILAKGHLPGERLSIDSLTKKPLSEGRVAFHALELFSKISFQSPVQFPF
jgi:hypothetical protein